MLTLPKEERHYILKALKDLANVHIPTCQSGSICTELGCQGAELEREGLGEHNSRQSGVYWYEMFLYYSIYILARTPGDSANSWMLGWLQEAWRKQ